MTKTKDEMKVNICGWNFGTHDKFTELYLFLIKSKNTVTAARDKLFQELSQDAYVRQLIDEVEKSRRVSMLRNPSFLGGGVQLEPFEDAKSNFGEGDQFLETGLFSTLRDVEGPGGGPATMYDKLKSYKEQFVLKEEKVKLSKRR